MFKIKFYAGKEYKYLLGSLNVYSVQPGIVYRHILELEMNYGDPTITIVLDNHGFYVHGYRPQSYKIYDDNDDFVTAFPGYE